MPRWQITSWLLCRAGHSWAAALVLSTGGRRAPAVLRPQTGLPPRSETRPPFGSQPLTQEGVDAASEVLGPAPRPFGVMTLLVPAHFPVMQWAARAALSPMLFPR